MPMQLEAGMLHPDIFGSSWWARAAPMVPPTSPSQRSEGTDVMLMRGQFKRTAWCAPICMLQAKYACWQILPLGRAVCAANCRILAYTTLLVLRSSVFWTPEPPNHRKLLIHAQGNDVSDTCGSV